MFSVNNLFAIAFSVTLGVSAGSVIAAMLCGFFMVCAANIYGE